MTVDLAAGTADGDASVGHDTFTGVNRVRGSYFADTLLGSNNPSGTAEFFEGRGGDDFINGRGGFDRAVYLNEDAPIVVHLAAGDVFGGPNTGHDTLRSIEVRSLGPTLRTLTTLPDLLPRAPMQVAQASTALARPSTKLRALAATTQSSATAIRASPSTTRPQA